MSINKSTLFISIALALGIGGMSHAETDSVWPIDASLQGDVLEDMRGGMLTEHGLSVNVGLQREVYINGELVSTTTLTLTELTRLLSGAAPRAQLGGDAGMLVQTGAGNTSVMPLDSSSFATVIQNTLDNQVIRGVTQINADVSNLELLRGMAVTSSAAEMIGRSR